MLLSLKLRSIYFNIAIPVYLKKEERNFKFIARKIVHLCSGLVVLIVP